MVATNAVENSGEAVSVGEHCRNEEIQETVHLDPEIGINLAHRMMETLGSLERDARITTGGDRGGDGARPAAAQGGLCVREPDW